MLTIFLSYDKKPDCIGAFDTIVFLEHPRKANVSYKASWCNAQVSIIVACKNMHDCIIDKT